jgi:tetratricopeptide (TPR) repeat protein
VRNVTQLLLRYASFTHSPCVIVSSSEKEVVPVKSVAVLAAVLLLSPLVPAQQPAPQPPPASNPASQKLAPTVQHEANFDAERAQANQLFLAGKHVEALPLYEDLCRQDQANPAFAERHGQALLEKSMTVSDPQQKQAMQTEGNKELMRAESLGDRSPYVEKMLGLMEKTPFGVEVAGPFGGLPLTVGYYYRGSLQAQPMMQQGEAAFEKGDFATALKFYVGAAATDPTWYEAALFAGDMYYRLKDYANAGPWFAKAITIDPDRETAYRYWGDALLESGDAAAAKVKFEQAMAAEPYTRVAYSGLRAWAIESHITLLPGPRVAHPEFITPQGKLAIDPAFTTETGDGHASWLVYQQHRVAHGARTIGQFMLGGSVMRTPELNFVPNGYVHTLAEEVDAMSAMLEDVKKKLTSGAVAPDKLEPGLKTLLQLQKDNMLEPFIMLNFNDAGIKHGYSEYRAAHRDQVVSYIDRYMIGPPTPANAPSPYVRVQP